MRATAAPPVSVAILSHRRPHLLPRVLMGVSQLAYPNFEIVVVGDEMSLDAYDLPPRLARQVRYVQFDRANICRSRNLAVGAAAGEIVAFIDDDAVPEPDWLTQIVRAFAFPNVGGVGGLVRASDGITVEWSGGVFDRAGVERPMNFSDHLRVFDAQSQIVANEFIGTLGANSAFRREAVQSVGGFDESFRYYLDETDLMLRLAEAGWDAALVRLAEVHHLREENAVRSRLRTPRNLTEIAASKAYFCRRHMPPSEVPGLLREFRAARHAELDPHLRLGLLRRADIDRLMRQVDDGIAAGLVRDRILPMSETSSPARFTPIAELIPDPELSVAIVTGWGLLPVRRARRAAKRIADAGFRVSCLSFLSGLHARTVDYQDGVWLHRGGTWRLDHRFGGRRVFGRQARAAAEIKRVALRRTFDVVLSPAPSGHDARAVRLPGLDGAFFATAFPDSPVQIDDAVARLMAGLDQLGYQGRGKVAEAEPAAGHEAALKVPTTAG